MQEQQHNGHHPLLDIFRSKEENHPKQQQHKIFLLLSTSSVCTRWLLARHVIGVVEKEMTTPISQFYKVIHTKVIGQGISGKVCECVRKADGVSFAVKIINRKSLTVADAQHIANEIRCLQTLDHPNIVQLVDTFEDATNFYLVMEYIRGGELFSRISKKQYYNERDARDLCEQILAGIKHCHDHDIVHRFVVVVCEK